jgi:O-antigen/teichoic acid export membrane protein
VFWLGLSEATSRALIFISTVYLARTLGEAGFGLFSLSMAVGVFAWVVVDTGITGYGTREIAWNRERTAELYCVLNSLRTVLAVTLFLIFCGVLYFISGPLQTKLILMAGAFYAVACSFSADWVLRGLEKMQYIFAGRIISSLIFICGIYFLVKTPSDALPAAIIYSFSFLIGSWAFIIILARKFKIPFSLTLSVREWLSHIRNSFYFLINDIFNQLFMFIPIFFMGFWNTHEDIGIFSAPHRLIMVVANTAGLVMESIYPTLSNLYVDEKEKFKRTFTTIQKIMTGIAMPVVIMITFLSKEIIQIIYGFSYISGGMILNVLIWYVFLVIIRRNTGISLFSAGFQRYNMYATGVGMIVIMLTSIALIPQYAGYGAACALLAGEAVTLILMTILFIRKVFCSDFFTSYLIKVVFAGAVMGLLLFSLPFSAVMNVGIGLAAYGFLAYFIGIIDKRTLQNFCMAVLKSNLKTNQNGTFRRRN